MEVSTQSGSGAVANEKLSEPAALLASGVGKRYGSVVSLDQVGLSLDEPTSALDPAGRRAIRTLLLGLCGRGIPFLDRGTNDRYEVTVVRPSATTLPPATLATVGAFNAQAPFGGGGSFSPHAVTAITMDGLGVFASLFLASHPNSAAFDVWAVFYLAILAVLAACDSARATWEPLSRGDRRRRHVDLVR